MRLAVVVNRAEEVVATQTTAMLLAAAARRAHEVHVCGVADLALEADGRVTAGGLRLPSDLAGADDAVRALEAARPARLVLDAVDALLVRTNPARDAGRAGAHGLALSLGRLLATRGVTVRNEPDGLARAASKLYLAALPPGTTPPSVVSAGAAALLAAIRAADGPVALKPLAGTRGRGVFRVAPDDANAPALVDLVAAGGPALVQPWLPEAAAGDVRVVLVGGAPLTVDGHVAAIRRVPAPGDLRSNLHAGGTAAPAALTDAQRATLAAVAPRLAADGLWLVGADLVGARIIELNVFATGGLRDAERFAGVDFAGAVVASLERQVARGT